MDLLTINRLNRRLKQIEKSYRLRENVLHQYLLAAIEWVCFVIALILLYPKVGYMGILGLFFAYVGFELHLIYHRRDRERKSKTG